MKNLISIVISICGLACSSAALANEDVATLLSGFEYVPSEAELLRGRTPPELEAELVALSQDARRPVYLRARATSWLGRLRGEESRRRIDAILGAADEHPMVVRAAVRAAPAFGSALRPRLVALLGARDIHLREAAVVALARSGAGPTLEAHLALEPSPHVRHRIRELLLTP